MNFYFIDFHRMNFKHDVYRNGGYDGQMFAFALSSNHDYNRFRTEIRRYDGCCFYWSHKCLDTSYPPVHIIMLDDTIPMATLMTVLTLVAHPIAICNCRIDIIDYASIRVVARNESVTVTKIPQCCI